MLSHELICEFLHVSGQVSSHPSSEPSKCIYQPETWFETSCDFILPLTIDLWKNIAPIFNVYTEPQVLLSLVGDVTNLDIFNTCLAGIWPIQKYACSMQTKKWNPQPATFQ